jgi:DNA-binding beta-propeller fold protein YncE
MVSTIAGNGAGYGDGGKDAAKFNNPYRIAVDRYDNIYIADCNNHRIRKINNQGIFTF